MPTSVLLFLFVVSLAGCGGSSGSSQTSGNVSVGRRQGIVIHSSSFCAHPGLVRLPSGNLLTAYYCDDWEIQTQLSQNQGATWNTPVRIFQSTDPAYEYSDVNLNLLPNGILFLTFVQSNAATGRYAESYMVGTIGAEDNVTWGPPVIVSTPQWNKCAGTTPLIQLTVATTPWPAGTLLWPVYCRNAQDIYYSSTVLVSTDGGATWPTQVTIADGVTDGRNYDETAGVQFPNGDVVMMLRQTTIEPNGTYWRTVLPSGGSTWSAPAQVIDVTLAGRPTLTRLASGGLVQVNRAQIAGVSTTGYGTSWDEGRTWTPFSDLGVSGPGTGMDNYNAATLLPDASIALVTVHGDIGSSTNIDYRTLVGHDSPPL